MPIDIQGILTQLEQQIASLAKTSVKNYATQAQSDGQAILTSMKADLVDWTNQVANGTLKASDIPDLIAGDSDNLKMAALTQIGLAEIEADQFKQSVLDLITKTITAAI
jgi:phage-related minor tail protein